ncbi:MAG: anhydro-N-acetylmuramic acid kinase [Ignavibacteriales bacterium]|nr:anhydro-N-acetylmuramic acid kinase [Ignavibacteriales bacterium]
MVKTRLESIIRKKERLVVGLMSGTSVDSIDAVLVHFTGSGPSVAFRQLAFHTHIYPKGYKDYVLKNSLPGGGTVESLSSLNILSAHFFADAARSLAKKAGIPLSSIDLIGSHGQTVHHLPEERTMFGKKIRSTLQLGDPSTIAKLTGIVTVGNFRMGDMALGGQGAPLVPYFDLLAFRSATKNRLLLNIGGIANATLLKKNCTARDVVAFDTGPGNMLIDGLMKRFYSQPFDQNGMIAQSGNIEPLLLKYLMSHPYLQKTLPKSTGRELFGDHFINKILNVFKGLRKPDIIATVTEFTALSIYDQYLRFLRKRLKGDILSELVISGGGSRNTVLVDSLRRNFDGTMILMSDDLGVPSASKEALCFAVLANETVCGNPSNIPGVTGALRQTILGSISA